MNPSTIQSNLETLLETQIQSQEIQILQSQYRAERDVIQGKLDLLINEVKKAKQENSKLQEIEKLNPQEIVLDPATISEREAAKTYAAEKLNHELKKRIAIALAREELLDIHCNDDFVQRDGKIKYLNKNNHTFVNFYENKLDNQLAFILNQSEEIMKGWQDTLIEEYRVQASALTEQQNKELDDAEAKGGDSTDDVMQKLGSRGIEIGAKKEHFLPQLWLLDSKSRSDQQKLIVSAAAAIRDEFNKKAVKLFERKENEVKQHDERLNRRAAILNEFKTLPDAIKQVADFSQNNTWLLDLEEMPEKITNVDPNEIDDQLEELFPGLFDIQQRKIARMGKQKTADEEDSDAKKQRLRALMDMMNGVLEIKDDIFATDIPKPKFMFGDPENNFEGKIPEADWDEEMKKLAKNYEKKVKLLEETRVKYKQQLLSESKKLVETDNQAAVNFDSSLHQLCHAKCDADAEQHSILLRGNRLKLVDEHSRMVSMKLKKLESIMKDFMDWDDTMLKNLLVGW